ncbi:MAG: hypothetical protein ACLUSL_11550 [Ruminococcus sp.]
MLLYLCSDLLENFSFLLCCVPDSGGLALLPTPAASCRIFAQRELHRWSAENRKRPDALIRGAQREENAMVVELNGLPRIPLFSISAA